MSNGRQSRAETARTAPVTARPTTTAAARLATGSRSIPVDGRKYIAEVNADLTFPHRTAQFLDGCAKRNPFQLIRYDEIWRAVNLFPTRQKLGNDDLKRVKSYVQRANSWLHKYGRALVLGADGARASVDDQDIVESVTPKKVGRMQSAIKSLQDTDALINARNVQGEMGGWYTKAVKPCLNTLTKVRDQLLDAAPEPKALPPKAE